MEEFVSFETAVLLARKNFYQPKRKLGQVWYFLHTGQPVVVGSALGNELEKYDAVFAPRATDFLLFLGSDYSLHTENGIFVWMWGGTDVIAHGRNPAAAIAIWYLSNVK